MRDFDEHNITEAVLDRFAKTPDPRLKRIVSSLVTHLHDFVRDVELSCEEWSFAINFLTRTGHMCDDKRQEFILLSDTLGVSMLVDAINHRMPEGVTDSTVLGPFYVQNPAELPLGADVAGGAGGERLFVSGTVADVHGAPLAGAIVDIWHSDQEGFYDVQDPDMTEPSLRARFRTDEAGRFHFWSIMPRWYPIPHDGPVGQMLAATRRHPNRPAHIHFMIHAEGYETLVTHIFADDSPWIDGDAVFGVKNSLIAHFSHEPPGRAPDGSAQAEPWRRLTYDFGLKKDPT
jgi:hydroxyquinol 1,2-dioxygenase